MALPIIAAGAFSSVVATTIRFFIGSLISRVILAFGIAVVSFTVIGTVASAIESRILSNIGGLGGQFASIASALGLTTAINIIASAYIAAVAIRQVMGAYNRITFGNTAGGGN